MTAQGMVGKQRFDIRCGVFALCEGLLLTVKERSSGLRGASKGGAYFRECSWETARRELMEETGVLLSTSQLNRNTPKISVKSVDYWGPGLTTVHVYYIVHLKSKPVVTIQKEEITEFKWMTIEDLSKERVSHLTRKAIKEIKAIQA